MFESFHELWFRIRSRFRRDALDAELEEELRAHAQFLENEARGAGASADDARRAASARLGNLTNIKENTRERWSFGWVEALLQDARYAFRFLRRSPGFTAVAVLSLALGIGANATVFSVADKLLFSAPAHVVKAGELYRLNVQRSYPGDTKARPFNPVLTFPEYFALREHANAFSELALYLPTEKQRLGRGPDVPRIKESMVSTNFFEALGVTPFRGRFLLPSDESPSGSLHAAVISYGFWKRQFGGADSAVGAHFEATKLNFVVVGIAPEGFTGVEMDAADTWVSVHSVGNVRIDRDWKEYDGFVPNVVTRLRANVSQSQAETEATTLLRRLPQSSGAKVQPTVALGPVVAARGPSERSGAVEVSTRLVIASLLVLVAACANLANLLLVRALTRQREIALRLAIGVSRMRLVSQMLLESMMLAAAGVVTALAIARWSGDALRSLIFPELQWVSGAVGIRVLLFSAAIAAVVAAIATIAPALRMTRADVAAALRAGAPQLTQSTGRLRQGLLALQVALSVMLVVGAAAFSKSLENALRFDTGVDVERLIIARVGLESDSVSGLARAAMFDESLRRIRTIPGVESAVTARQIPLFGNSMVRVFEPQTASHTMIGAASWQITPEMQSIVGFRLRRGRFITENDVRPGLPKSVLVSETGAKKLWPGVDPINQCIRVGTDTTPCLRVVGVVKDMRQLSIREDNSLSMLVGVEKPRETRFIVVRASERVELEKLIPLVRRALVGVRPDISSLDVRTLAKSLDYEYRPLRLGTLTFGSFALLTTLLAAIGLYGILAFSVTQRTSEFGIRSALGAQARHIVSSVVREGLGVVGVGIVIGGALSWYASTAIAALLFQSSARDLLPYVYASAALGFVAIVASIVPAWRAMCVDPAIALRAE